MENWNKTDSAARSIYCCLAQDLSRLVNHPIISKSCTYLTDSPTSFRALEWPILGDVSPYTYKVIWQLQNFLKRHRFQNDVYTDEELAVKSAQSFIDCQLRLPSGKSTKAFVSPVLREARRIAREILGSTVDMTALRQRCRFGKRATLGSPLRYAYLDSKLTDPKSLTCPTSLRSWFLDFLNEDTQLRSIITKSLRDNKKGFPPFNDDVLDLVNVPKSWKAFRGITPLQLIALFYSYGYKDLMEEALENYGLDIRHLQARHRAYAKRFSKSHHKGRRIRSREKHATVDLQEASNSIVSWLLNAVLPRQWYVALRPTFMRQLRLPGWSQKSMYTQTVLPMGNAATFPVETLIFYCLIKAVGNLLKVKGTYSVYGDDLIYPCAIHSYVSQVFSELGLKINAEKTFASISNFRESCGGDYYQGVDVRPALAPEYNGESMTRIEYAAWLYKLYNSLERRWDKCEIPSTLSYIESEIAFVTGCVYQVPPNYPDYAGIKTSDPYTNWVTGRLMPFRHLVLPPRLTYDTQDFHRWEIGFRCIATTVADRKIHTERVYYWEYLFNRALTEPSHKNTDMCALYWLTQPKSERVPWKSMRWRFRFTESFRSSLSLRREQRSTSKGFTFVSVEPSKSSPRFNDQTCTVINWTQDLFNEG